MVEIFRHLFGVCGDGHPSLLYLLGVTPALIYLRNRISIFFRNIRLILKK